MSKFVDKIDYCFKLFSKEDGFYLKRGVDEIKIDVDLANYYLENYTLQKGSFLNSFRKIECEDGEIRFYGREHSEYKKAIKESTMSIKNIEIGEVLTAIMYYQERNLIYIGSFYEKRYGTNPIRKHAFYDKNKDIIYWFKDLKRFTEVSGFESKFIDRINNYNKYIKKDNKNFGFSYFLTISDAKEDKYE